MSVSQRQLHIALPGMFAALAFVLGRIPRPPNLEFVTFTVFAAGFIGGSRVGAATGALVALLQFTFGGGGSFFLMGAQIVGWAVTGAIGGRFAGHVPRIGVLALLGALVTIWYQLLVNLALVPGSGLTIQQIFIPAIPFAAPHVLYNAVLFELGRFLLQTVERHPTIRHFRRLEAAEESVEAAQRS